MDSAVPTFFVISGFFLGLKLKKERRNISFKEYFKTYVHRYLYLYLFWTLIYLPFSLYHQISIHDNLIVAIITICRNIIINGQNWMSWSLWYLLAIVVSFIYVWIIRKISDNTWFYAAIGILSGTISYFLYFYTNLPFIRVYLTGLSFICSGIVATRLYEKPLYISIIILIIGFVISCSTHFLRWILWSMGIVLCCTKINLQSNKLYPWLRKMSSKIYLLHLIVLFFIWYVFRIRYSFLTTYLSTIALTILLSAIVIKIENYKYINTKC